MRVLSFRNRLRCLACLPLLVLLGVLVPWLQTLDRQLALLDATVRQTHLMTDASRLAHTLQAERGLSYGMLAAGRLGDGAVAEARGASDAALVKLGWQAAAHPMAQTIQTLRQQVDARNATPATLFADYSKVIASQLHYTTAAVRKTQRAETLRQQFALLGLLCLKEAAAQERGLLNGVISAGRFASGERDKLIGLLARQQRCEADFTDFADPPLLAAYNQHRHSPLLTRLMQLRSGMLAEPAGFPVTAPSWFSLASERLGSLQVLGEALLDTIRNDALRAQADLRNWFHLSVLAASLLALMLALLLWSITASLRRTLGGEPEQVARIAHAVAHGQLAQTIVLRKGDQHSVLAAMQSMLHGLGGTAAALHQGADQLVEAALQLERASFAMATASGQQAAGIEETAASVQQIASAIGANSDHARQTAVLAGESSLKAHEGGTVVTEAVAVMHAVAAQIAAVDEIAYQTNMLALNATIEAARAGPHGKGFAVVAGEVRRLAEHAAAAAREVAEVARTGVQTTQQAQAMLAAIEPAVKRTSELVSAISAACAEQSGGTQQINIALGQISQSVQENAGTAEELAHIAADLRVQAESLHQLVRFFALEPAHS